jgi:putative oxidoreductase
MSRTLASFAARTEAPTYAALRIVTGALFLFHGVQKIFGFLSSGHAPTIGTQVWFGGLIELTCGALVAVGLFTRCAAFIASGTMAVAYFQFHWRFAFAGYKFLPAINKGELAVLYCFAFLYIAAHGAGLASLDARRGSRR